MSVNPDDMNMTSGVAQEYVDLEHQVIRQQINLPAQTGDSLFPGEDGAEFDPGERQLDREEIAQLVYYRRFASISFVGDSGDGAASQGASVDASIGINGDLFREVTTERVIDAQITVDEGGEIGLLDNYTVAAYGPFADTSGADIGPGGNGTFTFAEHDKDYYNWPTGGPIVDSFDTITAGFGCENFDPRIPCEIELRYDLYWDVAEQGRSTNPFGRPSTR